MTANVTISKIQHRTGNDVDLPQLDVGEFGFSTDARRLYIGNDLDLYPSPHPSTETSETEVLTEHSLIKLTQIEGAGNLSLDITDPHDGEVFAVYVQGTVKKMINSANMVYDRTVSTLNVPIIESVIGINSNVQPNIHTVGDLTNLTVTGNTHVGGTLNVVGNTSFTNLAISGNETIGGTLVVTGNTSISNLNATGNLNASGNISTSSNLSVTGNAAVAGNQSIGGILSVTGNIATLDNLTVGGNATVTGNISTSKNLSVTGNAAVAGNQSIGGTLQVTGNTSISNLNATGNVTASGNISTSSNLSVSGNTVVTGNINTSNNLSVNGNANIASNLIVTGNIGGNNLNITNNISTNSLTSNSATFGVVQSGDVTITGNLTVSGNTFQSNVSTMSVKDPIIELGGSGSNIPLSSNDGYDRGTLLHYYNSAPIDAFMGWKTSNSEFIFASNASIASNNIVTVNTYADVRAGKFIGDGSLITNITPSAINGQVANALVAGTVYSNAQPNINSVGTLTSLNVSGNINAGNISATGLTGTLSTASQPNITSVGTLTSLSVSGNINGTLSTASQPNITSVGTLTSLSVSGNINAGNISATGLTGTLSTASQPNITSVGTLTSLTVSGNVSMMGPNVSFGNIGNVHIDGGTDGYFLQTNGAGGLTWQAVNAQIPGAFIHTQASAATTWTVLHNLGYKYLNVEVVDASGNSFTGRYDYPTVTFVDSNKLTIVFTTPQTGYVAVSSGGGLQGPMPPISGANTQIQFNDGGSFGASSGLTFNKNTNVLNVSSGILIGANTAIHAGNYNSYSPTLTGSGASGNWGINITGSANTVTASAQPNITSVGTLTSLNVSGNISGNVIISNTPTGIAPFTVLSTTQVANLNAATAGIATVAITANSVAGANVTGTVANATVASSANSVAYANVTGKPTNVSAFTNDSGYITNYGSITGSAGSVSIDNTITWGRQGLQFVQISGAGGTDPALTQAPDNNWWHIIRANHGNSSGYYTDLALPFTSDGGVQYRRISAGTNNGWYTLLDSHNYNIWAPTLTGTGASGTWGINVTGTAGSVAWSNVSGKPTTVSSFTNDAGYITGNAALITTGTLATARLGSGTASASTYLRGDQTWATVPAGGITDLTGDVTASGSGSVAATLSNSGVSAGTYKSVTVDLKGRVTSGTNPTTLSGYGITDAQPLDADLTAIAGLSGTSGILKKTATDTWTLDTSSYLTSATGVDLTSGQTIGGVKTFSSTITGNISGSASTSTSATTAKYLNSGSAATAATITGQYTLTTGSTLQSTYADLAEYYSSDSDYEAGTIVSINTNGDADATEAVGLENTNVLGIVSTDPAYMMNGGLTGTRVCIALAGRVPCKVIGKVNKGDLIVTSTVDGVGTSSKNPKFGSVVGKALQSYDSDEVGLIEVFVTRF